MLPSLPSKGTPDHSKWIAGRVTTMLGHFYIPDEDEEVFAMQIVDWVEALSGFPADVIQKSVREYLANEQRRPTIAAIRGLCFKNMPRPAPVPPPDPVNVAPSEPRVSLEKRAEIVEGAGIESPVLRKVLRGEGVND